MYAGVALLMIAYAADEVAPARIALRYEAIASEFRQRVGESRNSLSRVSEAQKHRDVGLENLVEDARKTEPSALSARDCVALSDACQLLRKPLQALEFARAAVHRDSTEYRSNVVLIRSLVSLGRLEEADAAIQRFTSEAPDGKELYVLHHMVALGYEQLGQLEHARRHMSRVVDKVILQLGSDPFFLAHLERSIDIWARICEKGNDREIHAQTEVWYKSLHIQTSVNFARVKSDETGRRINEAELIGLNLQYCGLFLIAKRLGSHSAASTLEDWLMRLTELLESEKNDAGVLRQITAGVNQVAKMVTSEMDSCGVVIQLNRARSVIDAMEEVDTENASAMLGIKVRLNVLEGIIDQQTRCDRLIGTEWWPSPIRGSAGSSFSLIHVVNPLAPNAPKGLESIRELRGRLSREKIDVAIVSPRIGLAIDHKAKRFAAKRDQSLENELKALKTFIRDPTIAQAVGLMDEDSECWRKLDAKYFPVNVLLDANAKVVWVETGPEPEKLHSVLLHASAKKTADQN